MMLLLASKSEASFRSCNKKTYFIDKTRFYSTIKEPVFIAELALLLCYHIRLEENIRWFSVTILSFSKNNQRNISLNPK